MRRHTSSVVLCLAITLVAGGVLTAQEAKKPTLYVDKIETNEDEVFVIYS